MTHLTNGARDILERVAAARLPSGIQFIAIVRGAARLASADHRSLRLSRCVISRMQHHRIKRLRFQIIAPLKAPVEKARRYATRPGNTNRSGNSDAFT
jgi:hypothetical protein